MEKPTVVDLDEYKGEWIALDPKSEVVLSHSRSFLDAERQALEQGTDPVMEFIPASDGYFIGWL